MNESFKTRIVLALLLASLGSGLLFSRGLSAQEDDCVKYGGHPLWFDTTSSIPYFGQQTGCAFGRAIVNSTAFSGALGTELPNAILNFKKHPQVGALPPGRQAAYVYCQKVGGKPIITYERPVTGSSTAYTALASPFLNCQFSDGSQIEAETLFKGPNDPINASLAQALTPPADRMPASQAPPSLPPPSPSPSP